MNAVAAAPLTIRDLLPVFSSVLSIIIVIIASVSAYYFGRRAKNYELLYKERLDSYSVTIPAIDNILGNLFTLDHIIFADINSPSFKSFNEEKLLAIDEALRDFIKIRYRHTFVKPQSRNLLDQIEPSLSSCLSYLRPISNIYGFGNINPEASKILGEKIVLTVNLLCDCKNQMYKDLGLPEYKKLAYVDNSKSYVERRGYNPIERGA